MNIFTIDIYIILHYRTIKTFNLNRYLIIFTIVLLSLTINQREALQSSSLGYAYSETPSLTFLLSNITVRIKTSVKVQVYEPC